jgi:hypothetical protein
MKQKQYYLYRRWERLFMEKQNTWTCVVYCHDCGNNNPIQVEEEYNGIPDHEKCPNCGSFNIVED